MFCKHLVPHSEMFREMFIFCHSPTQPQHESGVKYGYTNWRHLFRWAPPLYVLMSVCLSVHPFIRPPPKSHHVFQLFVPSILFIRNYRVSIHKLTAGEIMTLWRVFTQCPPCACEYESFFATFFLLYVFHSICVCMFYCACVFV